MLVHLLSLPWWYRVTRELRDLGRATGTALGRRPWTAVVVLAVPLLGVAAHLLTIGARLRRAQQLADLPVTLAPRWRLLLGLLLPPVLLWHLQGELNKVWLRLGTPIRDAPAQEEDAQVVPPPPGSRRLRRVVAAGSLGVAAYVGVVALAVSTLPIAYGDDPALDALWDSCAGGDFPACQRLAEATNRSTRYHESAVTRLAAVQIGDVPPWDALWEGCTGGGVDACQELIAESHHAPAYVDRAWHRLDSADRGDFPAWDQLWDACAAGDLDACYQLWIETSWESGYWRFAEGRLAAATYGDVAELDELWDACAEGAIEACNELTWSTPEDSGYQRFGLERLDHGAR